MFRLGGVGLQRSGGSRAFWGSTAFWGVYGLLGVYRVLGVYGVDPPAEPLPSGLRLTVGTWRHRALLRRGSTVYFYLRVPSSSGGHWELPSTTTVFYWRTLGAAQYNHHVSQVGDGRGAGLWSTVRPSQFWLAMQQLLIRTPT